MLLMSLVPGSSPLARGAPGEDHRLVPVDGIIPARAGSTHFSLGLGYCCRDHPRSRGEHSRRSSRPSATSGSSPLARGALGFRRGIAALGGIIPARAGSTHRFAILAAMRWDHPRSRGEHTFWPRTLHRRDQIQSQFCFWNAVERLVNVSAASSVELRCSNPFGLGHVLLCCRLADESAGFRRGRPVPTRDGAS